MKNISDATGGKALRIKTSDVAYVKFEKFYFHISSAVLKNVSLGMNCEATLNNITIGMKNTFHADEDNFIVGRQTKEPIHLKISGISAKGPYSKNITIPGLQPNQVNR